MRDKDWKTLEKNPECTTYLIIYRPEGVCNGSYELRNFSRQGKKKVIINPGRKTLGQKTARQSQTRGQQTLAHCAPIDHLNTSKKERHQHDEAQTREKTLSNFSLSLPLFSVIIRRPNTKSLSFSSSCLPLMVTERVRLSRLSGSDNT